MFFVGKASVAPAVSTCQPRAYLHKQNLHAMCFKVDKLLKQLEK